MIYEKILKIIPIIVIISLLSSFSGCINNSDHENGNHMEKNDVLIFATFNNKSIYPYSISIDNLNTLMINIFNGLVEFNEFFQISPSLAISWNNPNNLTWRFFLREGVKFHNGYNFTAHDVKYSFSLYQSYKSFIKDVIVQDNYTIDIITFDPFPGFLHRIAYNFLIFPSNYDKVEEFESPIGTGAYKFVEYIENNYTKLEVFEDYWRKKPEIKTIIFKLIEDKQKRINDLIAGNIDIAEYNVDKNINEILKNDEIIIQKFPPLSTYIIGFDVRENNSYSFPDGENPTSDIRVRKAIYQAIDVEPLINGPFMGYAKPASQFLTPYIFGYNPDINRIQYNLSNAKLLLKEAGYKNGFDIVMDCITVGYEYNVENCQLITNQLLEIGVNVSINNLSRDEFNKKVVEEKNTSLWLVGWGTISFDGGLVYNNFIMSEDEINGYYNSGHYSNLEVDRLGVKASYEMNPIVRLNLLQDGFKIALVDDIIVIPLFSQELFVLTTDSVIMQLNPDMRLIVENIKLI